MKRKRLIIVSTILLVFLAHSNNTFAINKTAVKTNPNKQAVSPSENICPSLEKLKLQVVTFENDFQELSLKIYKTNEQDLITNFNNDVLNIGITNNYNFVKQKLHDVECSSLPVSNLKNAEKELIVLSKNLDEIKGKYEAIAVQKIQENQAAYLKQQEEVQTAYLEQQQELQKQQKLSYVTQLTSLIPGGSLAGTMITTGLNGFMSGNSDIKALRKTVKEAEALLQQSIDIQADMLLNKDDIEKFNLQLKETQNIKNTKEKNAAVNKIYQEKTALLEKQIEQADTVQKLQSISDKQKSLFSGSLYNLALASMKDADAGLQGANIATSIAANPMMATKYASSIIEIKDISISLPIQAGKLMGMVKRTKELSDKAGIKAEIPVSKCDKPKIINEF